MTFRSILVHVDGTERADARTRVAARLAQTFPAQVVGVYIVPGPDVSPFATALIPPDFIERRLRLASDAQHAAEAGFREILKAAAVKHVAFRAPVGEAAEAAIEHSRYADLVVLGQPPRDEPEFHFSMELANSVLMGSGRPVLFVPYTGVDGPIGERVLIAWKDSRESARAVADALPILKDAKKVLAVAIASTEEETLKDLVTDKQIEGFLARHEVQAQVKRIVAPDIAAGELLLSHAADIGADLIVMGGYSRPRFTQLVWGGVSKLILNSMTVPVLMSH
jgi:nucleotide-binding universal stress UspA family protein